ncbi:MAG TPA: NIPSNAP family protein [Chitinophagaceae bacterium]|nr:NIPSNAP family protein [Chitinophagaceae bacterium]
MKSVAFASVLLVIMLAVVCPAQQASAAGKPPAQELYEIKVYHFKTAAQEARLDDYLRMALLPALHKMGIATAGVFKPIANDTATDKLIYVFMPVKSFEFFTAIPASLAKDAAYISAGADYLTAPYDNPPYTRMESILLKAFRLAPKMQASGLTNAKEERVYELRSYESPTEKLYANKVTMFNEGGEVPLFKRLGFNALFYAEVLVGSHMPNLMYMTSFENLAARNDHWKVFSADPEWKKLSGLPEYQHNVSKAEIILLHATPYSDL